MNPVLPSFASDVISLPKQERYTELRIYDGPQLSFLESQNESLLPQVNMHPEDLIAWGIRAAISLAIIITIMVGVFSRNSTVVSTGVTLSALAEGAITAGTWIGAIMSNFEVPLWIPISHTVFLLVEIVSYGFLLGNLNTGVSNGTFKTQADSSRETHPQPTFGFTVPIVAAQF